MFLNNGKIVLPPKTRKEIIENYPFHYKIVLGKEVPNELKKDIEYYRLNEKTTILLKNLNEGIIASIRNITSNYSIVETDLTDIYNYLTKK